MDSKVKRGFEPQNTQSEPILLRGRYCKITHLDGFSSSYVFFYYLMHLEYYGQDRLTNFVRFAPFHVRFTPFHVQFIFWYRSGQETSYSITTGVQAESEFGLEE